MHYILLLVAFIVPGILSASGINERSTCDTLTLATYNVRVRTTADTYERSWDKRKPHVANLIQNHRFHIVGVQELSDLQQELELSTLLPNYAVYSTGRNNTQATEGERIAIYYLKNKFSVLDKGYFFLSETPEVASKGWDAALNRMCNWMCLKETTSGKKVYVFNVHFDHRGTEARAQSAQLLVDKIKQIAGNATVVCFGDFNANPSELKVYTTMTGTLYDARTSAHSKHEKSIGTFNGWEYKKLAFDENLRIDYIFTNQKEVAFYGVLNERYQSDAFPSDHFPVMIKLALP